MNESAAAAWGEVRAGIRPSTVLAVGAILMAIGPVLDRSPSLDLMPWYVWATGMALAGIGLLMCTPHAWASALVSVAGLLLLLHSGALAAVLMGLAAVATAYRVLAIPKLVVLGLLAHTERHHHGRQRQLWLAAAGTLGLAKIVARTLAPEAPWHDVADMLINLLVATALWMFARGLRRREDSWARRRLAEVSASFQDFDRRSDHPSGYPEKIVSGPQSTRQRP